MEKKIFELGMKLWTEGISFTIKHIAAESPAIILETEHYLEVKTTADETMSLELFDTQRFETKSVEVMWEVLTYNIKKEQSNNNKNE